MVSQAVEGSITMDLVNREDDIHDGLKICFCPSLASWVSIPALVAAAEPRTEGPSTRTRQGRDCAYHTHRNE